MKTIGLIGGMSWESSAVYYELINKRVKERLGGYHSCKSILLSVDFDEIEKLQRSENWPELDKRMANAAKQLENAGADVVILCTNTMHLCAAAIEQKIAIPFIHIAKATGENVVSMEIKKVALLGTRFTMEKDFYKAYLRKHHNIEVIIPGKTDRNLIHQVIYDELVKGEIKPESKAKFKTIISKLVKEGAQGIVLGCTEIPLLITENDVNIPIFDTTLIHANYAADWALSI